MKFIKKFYAWEKAQFQKPETRLAIGIAIGMLIGVAMEDVGVGLVLGVALGVAGYVTRKKQIDKEQILNDEVSETTAGE